VILDESFGFLLASKLEPCEHFTSTQAGAAYLAGFFDAEGSIGIYRNAKTTALVLAFYNTDLGLLRRIHQTLSALGYHPLRPYLDKKKGLRLPGFQIEMKKDYWRVLVATFEESQDILRVLPLRHREKNLKKNLALSIRKGVRWAAVVKKVRSIRLLIRNERDGFVAEARTKLAERIQP